MHITLVHDIDSILFVNSVILMENYTVVLIYNVIYTVGV